MEESDAATRELIRRTGTLREDLLKAVARLEQYAEALQGEIDRLQRIADSRGGGQANAT